jgi:translation initiation factor 1
MGLFAGTPLERPVTCERCAQPLSECRCPRDRTGRVLLPKDQKARVRRERRNGKMTTVIAGLDPVATDLKALLKELKTSLGAGGTVNSDQEIEVQGDHRDKLVALLKSRGYDAKAAGG